MAKFNEGHKGSEHKANEQAVKPEMPPAIGASIPGTTVATTMAVVEKPKEPEIDEHEKRVLAAMSEVKKWTDLGYARIPNPSTKASDYWYWDKDVAPMVYKALGLDLKGRDKEIATFAAKQLRGFYRNDPREWAKVQWNDITHRHIVMVYEAEALFTLNFRPAPATVVVQKGMPNLTTPEGLKEAIAAFKTAGMPTDMLEKKLAEFEPKAPAPPAPPATVGSAS